MDRVKHLDLLTGTPVLSLATANKLGKIDDVFVDPLNGRLAGISIQRENEAETAVVYYAQIHSIGPDAVVIVGEESLLSAGESQLKDLPLAKSQLIGVKVLTEDGQFVGKISDIILRMVDPPDFIYEVRSSIFDKLLGHAFYLPASLGCALSSDRSALLISNDTERMDHKIEALLRRLTPAGELSVTEPGAPQVVVRSHV